MGERELSKADEEAAWMEYREDSKPKPDPKPKLGPKKNLFSAESVEGMPPRTMTEVGADVTGDAKPLADTSHVPASESLFPIFGSHIVKPKKKRKKKRKKRDPNRPKHPMSAYIFFCNDVRPRCKEANPDKKGNELMGIIAQAWREADDEQKKKFEVMAAADKIRYREEMKTYVPAPETKVSVAAPKIKTHVAAPKMKSYVAAPETKTET